MRNICCHYISSCIMRNTFSCIRKLYIVSYNEKYIFMYKRNICSYYISSCIIRKTFLCIENYTSSCIMRNTFSCFEEMFIVII